MGDKIKVACGTRKCTEMEVDLDEYGHRYKTTSIDEGQKRAALKLLKETMDTETFIRSGYRNDDAVNACIALHVLGYDPGPWLEAFLSVNAEKFYDNDVELFMDHVERVIPYLCEWGPEGIEGNALYYRID